MMTEAPISGLLNINKPKDITSHDVVARVRRLSGQRKVGHTGTLDPMATGVLLVCLGQATRLIEYLMPGSKQYRATICFGTSTDTLDATGNIVAQINTSTLTEAELRATLPQFVGEIQQVPPAFSAIKRNGQPLYKQARAGEIIEIEPRAVTIYDITWVNWSPPELTLDITCGAGTYIRSLARDIGARVGTGAHLKTLVRTANGRWNLAHSVTLETLEQAGSGEWLQYLQPLEDVIAHLPRITLNAVDTDHIQCGRKIKINGEDLPISAATHHLDVLSAYTPNGSFLAILQRVPANADHWQPQKVFQTKNY